MAILLSGTSSFVCAIDEKILKQNIRIKIKNMSKSSGVYKMLDRTGDVIYIGKAKNLKNRVSQYFTHSNHNNKMQALQKNIYDFFQNENHNQLQSLLDLTPFLSFL